MFFTKNLRQANTALCGTDQLPLLDDRDSRSRRSRGSLFTNSTLDMYFASRVKKTTNIVCLQNESFSDVGNRFLFVVCNTIKH